MGEKNSFATAPSRIGSMLPGSPPLWLSKIGKEYYLNGAKLIMRNLQASAPSGARQRLHVLDEVLEPLVPRSVENSAAYVDLTAGKLVRDSQAYNLRQHSIKYKDYLMMDNRKRFRPIDDHDVLLQGLCRPGGPDRVHRALRQGRHPHLLHPRGRGF